MSERMIFLSWSGQFVLLIVCAVALSVAAAEGALLLLTPSVVVCQWPNKQLWGWGRPETVHLLGLLFIQGTDVPTKCYQADERRHELPCSRHMHACTDSKS
jgi:hypothetical protein